MLYRLIFRNIASFAEYAQFDLKEKISIIMYIMMMEKYLY